MAHNLSNANGKTAMMYVGEVPWHHLGTNLDKPATAREAIEAAGLNYLVELKPLKTNDGTEVPTRKATVRSDTSDVLGVVGNGYVPVQNFQAFGPDPEEGKDNSRATNIRQELHRLFEEGIGHDAPEIKHTSWMAFNAVTEFVGV